jgi:L-rhamnonate dehydratase
MLWHQLYDSGSFYGRRGVFVMALSGIDNALWDIAGKYSGKPVYQMLGGDPKARITAYKSGSDVSEALSLGFRHVKVKPPANIRDGRAGMRRNLEYFSEVRSALAPDSLLMTDCLSTWNDVAYVIEMARMLEPANSNWIEEPLLPDNLQGYARLVREVKSTAIASGEHEYTQYGFAELLRHQAVGVVQPDVSWSGGVTALIRIARMAADHLLPFIPHRGGSLFGLPSALNAPHCTIAESFGTGDNGTDLMTAMTAPFRDGFYSPSEKPGFGTELTIDLVKNYIL